MNGKQNDARGIDALLGVMRRLRDPSKGCPWDLEQTHSSLAPHLIEEAYETAAAIDEQDSAHLCEELGDVLLQIVFHAQIASENGSFTFDDVAGREADKMVERHPHIFGNKRAQTALDVREIWETDKAEKRAAQAAANNVPHSLLDGISAALPAALRALKLQERAARAGFDWNKPHDIIAKIHEEADELDAEIEKNAALARMEDELGDLFFVLVNLARRLKIDPESALRSTNRKFEKRFRGIESALAASGRRPQEASLEELEDLWCRMKAVDPFGEVVP